MTAIWSHDRKTPTRLPLTPDRRHDHVVVGAGITGLATALLLARAGADVAVVEAREIGAGTTGNTTGKVSLLQGVRGQDIAERHSMETVRAYIDANRDAQRWLLEYCRTAGVDVQIRDAITYAQDESELRAVRAEHDIARRSGLPVDFVDAIDTPFPFHGGVRLPEQAQLDPMALLMALAADVESHGVPVHESTRVRGVGRGHDGDHVVHTDQGDLRAGRIVLATGTPILDRGGFFARVTAQRSYLAAFRIGGPVRSEMFLSAGSPTRSLRDALSSAGSVLLVGGNGHGVGRAADCAERVEDLIDWTRRHYPTAEPVATWSAQDYRPVGELPYAGPLLPGGDHILLATGYAKWGLTNGVAAALALTGRVTGDAPRWARAFATWRAPVPKAVPAAVEANGTVAREMMTGWLAALRPEGQPAPAEGCGHVRRHGLRPVATATVDGVTTEVSAVCPHLYGIVRWNSAEKSWDCPLHGSRFAADGTVLEGPATAPLPAAGAPRVTERSPN
ncbi:FAD-dependent oxidoreductase [Nocardia takedensis]|uniref:FAD-dependent oxidoreductase n=1 Tax=Nocardia takedensis TaxID=259390 RepID=UPI0003159E58|nr:FAD-dependent oxidoreductase [Nocardia takedensis]